MATFVLVHGAWHGGWCWKKVVPLLRAAGHEIYAPTLTGLGERAHLLTREIGLDTHVQDIVNLLEYEELTQVVLVGHSYGGMVITGVAERVPDRLRQLVYLDAAAPVGAERSLRTLYQRYTPARWAAFEAQIQGPGEGWLIPLPSGGVTWSVDAGFMGVTDPADLRWLWARLTAHPAWSALQELPGDHTPARHLPHAFILCPETPGAVTPFSAFGELVQAGGGRHYELVGGHDIMVTRPREFADLLGEIATVP